MIVAGAVIVAMYIGAMVCICSLGISIEHRLEEISCHKFSIIYYPPVSIYISTAANQNFVGGDLVLWPDHSRGEERSGLMPTFTLSPCWGAGLTNQICWLQVDDMKMVYLQAWSAASAKHGKFSSMPCYVPPSIWKKLRGAMSRLTVIICMLSPLIDITHGWLHGDMRGDNFMCVPRLVVKHTIDLIEVSCFLSASGYLSSISQHFAPRLMNLH